MVNRCRQDPVFVREKSPDKIPLFVETLEGADWPSLNNYENPDIVYNRFLELYTEIYNDCFPLKKVTRKQKAVVNESSSKIYQKEKLVL